MKLRLFTLLVILPLSGMAQPANLIYWADETQGKIKRAPIDGLQTDQLVSAGSPESIALDVDAGKMYWTDFTRIRRTNLDGSNAETLVTGLGSPRGIALDLVNDKMYWSDTNNKRIMWADLDGNNIQSLSTGTTKPYGIALDVAGGKMYWITQEPSISTGYIQSADLNGDNVTLLLSSTGRPKGIALDVEAGYVYWTEYNSMTIKRVLFSFPLFPETLVAGVNRPEDLALDIEGGYMYWTDSGNDKIQRDKLDGSANVETLVTGEINAAGIALDVAGGKVYWTDASTFGSVKRRDLVQELLTAADGIVSPLGVTLNHAVGKVYWTDWETNRIQRANLDGTSIEDLVFGLDEPRNIAFDHAAGMMYWTDSGTGKIQRDTLDGSINVQTLVTGQTAPFGLALDLGAGKMYWTDWVANKIQRANLDGSYPELILTGTDGLGNPAGLALDLPNGKMYWTDWETDTINRANLDGSEKEDLVTGLGNPINISLDLEAGKMYWADSATEKVQRANLDGTGLEDLYTGADGLDFPYGIAVDAPPAPSDLRVHVKRPAGWGLPHIQITSTTPDIGSTTSPGEPMIHEGCGWYSHRFEGAHTATFSFNGYPASPMPQTVTMTKDKKAFFVPDQSSGGDVTGTWHATNPVAACTDQAHITLLAYLQGPHDPGTDRMTTMLQAADLIPGRQPFADPLFDEDSPKEYNGAEESTLVGSGSVASITDWALVEVRTDANDPTTTLEAKAVLASDVGFMFDDQGEFPLAFKVPSGDYHVVVRARNHLSIISPAIFMDASNDAFHNFKTASTQALGTNPMVEVAPGRWAMWGGDGNGDDTVSAFDFLNAWLPINGAANLYDGGDFNMDGTGTAFDFLNVWLPANGKASQVVD